MVKKVAEDIRKEIKIEIDELNKKYNKVPGLAVVLVGERKDSMTYVRSKRKVCEELGIKQFNYDLEESTSQDKLSALVDELNTNEEIHGILVQLPLPKHINDINILDKVDATKDVDGFDPEHMGKIGMRGREPNFVPCTAKGVIELLQRYNVECSGKRAVVIGRSNIVGLPVQLMLQNLNATVTCIHSRTQNPTQISKDADIVVAACGQTEFIKKDWIKPGAVVIDVGMNTKDDPTAKRGYKLVGDVDYDQVKEVASLITPVPGGVGPMTIAILMQNTLLSFKRKLGLVK